MVVWLKQQKQQHPKSLLRTLLSENMAKSLVLELQALLWPEHAETAMAHIPDLVLERIANNLNAWSQKPSGTEGYRTAEVTLGGVDTPNYPPKQWKVKSKKAYFLLVK